MRSRTRLDSRKPSAAVGSSRMTTLEANAAARATAITWRCPPDIRPTAADLSGSVTCRRSSTSTVESSHRSPAKHAHRLRQPTRSGVLAARRRSWRTGRDCRTGPGLGTRSRCRSARAAAGELIVAGCPSIRISPTSRRCTPLMHLISVDFPAPLSPSIATPRPWWTSRSTDSSASTAPNRFVAPRTDSAGAPARHALSRSRQGRLHARGTAPRAGRARRRSRQRAR